MGVEPHARHIGHVAALAVVGLLVGDHPDILQERTTGTDRLHGILIAARDAERPHPVVARTDGHHGQQHLVGTHRLLDEEAVDHLVQRAVAADDDNPPVSLAYGRDGQLRGVELVLREDRFAEDVRIAQKFRDPRKVIEPAAAAGHGIHDHKPFVGMFCHLDATLLRGCCAAYRSGSRRTSPPRRSPPSRRASGGSRSSDRTRSCPDRDSCCR